MEEANALEHTDFFWLFPSLKYPCFLVFWFHHCVCYCCCFPISPFCKSGDESQWGRVSALKNLPVAIKSMTGILCSSLPTSFSVLRKLHCPLNVIIINSHIHGRCHPDFVSTASAQCASREHLELQIFLSYLLQVPSTEFGSPGRAVHDLNWWASFLAWEQCFRKSTLGAEQESN